MANIKKYANAFICTFEVKENEVQNMKYRDGNWDSVGHMFLITTIEDMFGIKLKPEDVMRFNSYEDGIHILEKYGIMIYD